jgi:hypothetical protein
MRSQIHRPRIFFLGQYCMKSCCDYPPLVLCGSGSETIDIGRMVYARIVQGMHRARDK